MVLLCSNLYDLPVKSYDFYTDIRKVKWLMQCWPSIQLQMATLKLLYIYETPIKIKIRYAIVSNISIQTNKPLRCWRPFSVDIRTCIASYVASQWHLEITKTLNSNPQLTLIWFTYIKLVQYHNFIHCYLHLIWGVKMVTVYIHT